MHNPISTFKHHIKEYIINVFRNKYQLVPLEETIHIDSIHNYLSGHNVLIVGVGENIGINICREMEKYGAKIFCIDKDKNLIETLRTSSNYVCYHLDSTNEQQCVDLFSKLEKLGVVIDTFIYNAGWQTARKSIRNASMSEWRKTIDINLLGPVHLGTLAAEHMIKNNVHGNMIFTSSIHDTIIGFAPGYAPSKAALKMFIKEFALNLSEYNIRVNGIAPGFVKTDETGQPVKHFYTPLMRTSIHPASIGRAAVYLASDYFSAHTTGTILKIDGGLSLHTYMSLHMAKESNNDKR
jgi:NAD(P)-dependent dehydrogenase (short-subunit alcohol dehydrogenase family)